MTIQIAGEVHIRFNERGNLNALIGHVSNSVGTSSVSVRGEVWAFSDHYNGEVQAGWKLLNGQVIEIDAGETARLEVSGIFNRPLNP